MNNNIKLIVGETYSNQNLMDRFHCSNSGGIRYSKKTNSLVLINDNTKELYDNKWVDDILHYSGQGMSGDQTLSRFNKRLAESIEQEIEVHLFEVEKATEYIYRGKVSLASEPYQEEQKGSDGNLRKVWIFPLALQSADQTIDLEFIKNLQEKEDSKAAKMSDEDLYKKAHENERKKVLQYKTTNTIYFRDAYVSEYAKRRANGKCQLCGEVAPFQNKDGKPYLETHHIIWLSQGGSDTIDNTVALCPNCHRKIHVLNLEEDQEHIKEVISHDDKN